IGGTQVPYFRTKEFSNLMFENEAFIKEFFDCPENGKAVFLTGSGTAGMECSVMNFFSDKDKVLVVNGGSFGHRFTELMEITTLILEQNICSKQKKGAVLLKF
ncbi:MAG: hypothetical protein MJ184_09460, partial [Treponema sp.]|nr:hypothetical protein [Treponema sp.]